MSEARFYWVKSRLSMEAFKPGGATVRDALLRAEAAIELGRDALIVSVDELIAELESCYGAGAKTPATGDHQKLYKLASRIIDISLCLRDSGIDKAADAICDLSEQIAKLGVWDQESVEIHIMALKLLRHADASMTAEQRAGVVDGLRKVTERRLGALEPKPQS